jgi:hypothetical protein
MNVDISAGEVISAGYVLANVGCTIFCVLLPGKEMFAAGFAAWQAVVPSSRRQTRRLKTG